MNPAFGNVLGALQQRGQGPMPQDAQPQDPAQASGIPPALIMEIMQKIQPLIMQMVHMEIMKAMSQDQSQDQAPQAAPLPPQVGQ